MREVDLTPTDLMSEIERMMRGGDVYYLLWGQQPDKSGEVFVRIFADESDAIATQEVIAQFEPSMSVKIKPVRLVRPGSAL